MTILHHGAFHIKGCTLLSGDGVGKIVGMGFMTALEG